MRVLIIGSSNPWRMERAVDRALGRAGHETLVLDDRRIKRLVGRTITQQWVRTRARRFRPDFVFLSKCLALDLATVAQIIDGVPNAMWYHDPQWYRDLARPDIGHIAAVGKLSDTFFITGFEEEWRAHGLPARFLPAAGDAGIIPVTYHERFASDVAFIGTGYDPSRAQLLIEVAKHHRVRVYGLGWDAWKTQLDWYGRPVEGAEFAGVCSSAKIVLGINPARASQDGARDAGFYTSDRTWMSILAGAFYLGQEVDTTSGMAQLLIDGTHCAWYTDVDMCLERIGQYIGDAERRAAIRARGESFVRAHHTYDARIRNLLSGTAWVNPARP